MRGWLALLSACTPLPEPPADAPPAALTISDLWAGERGTVTVDAVIASPRTASDRGFFVQAPSGAGPQACLEVVLTQILDDLPPPVGTAVQLTGSARVGPDGPQLWITSEGGVEVGASGDAVAPVPFDADAELSGCLVEVGDITVTSAVDPAGRADTDGPASVGGLFRPSPGWAASGQLQGILARGRVHPRTEADFDGPWIGEPPRSAVIADVRALPEGTPVRVEGVVQATPWDRSARWAVIQDLGDGRGLWVDTEAWDLRATSDQGDVGAWVGEVRRDGDGAFLRAWTPVDQTGAAAVPVEREEPIDGGLVRLEVTADDPRLDDRFLELSDLPATAAVLAAVRGDGAEILAVLEFTSTGEQP